MLNNDTLSRIETTTSRAIEYFSVAELQTMTGQPRENFATVILKELVDNAIDAAEGHSSVPEVDIQVGQIGEAIRISVSDNGPGIGLETVKKLIDFNVRSSTKAVYASPTRGMQGNALKTVLGIPFALGGKEPVVIESLKLRHFIRAWVDPAGNIRVDHQQEEITTTGTRITASIPARAQHFQPETMAREFCTFNPHVLVKFGCFEKNNAVCEHGNEPEAKTTIFYRPTIEPASFNKYLPTDLTSPHWYDEPAFEKLVFAHIADARNGGRNMTLREFARTFKGLSGTQKVKKVCDRFPTIKNVSDFDREQSLILPLLQAMKTASSAPKAASMGSVGPDHFRAVFEPYGLVGSQFWYKHIEGENFLVEAAVGRVEHRGGLLFHGVNFSPTFDDPITNARLESPKFVVFDLKSFLARSHCLSRDDESQPVAVAFHLVWANPVFLDKGKTRLSIPPAMAKTISACLWNVCKAVFKEEERRQKDTARQERRDRERIVPAPEMTLVDAVFRVIPSAFETATDGGKHPIYSRSFYYVVRKAIQDFTNKELDYGYFSQTLLPKYEEEKQALPGLYYDQRGVLYEPHSGREIAVGDRDIREYEFPELEFDKLLYIEKEGLWPVIASARIGKRFDIAILMAKGYASRAARVLFERAQGRNFKLYVLHDADPHGYNIARTLAEETARMKGFSIDVIDLGLTLDEGCGMGLETETFTVKKTLPTRLQLTDLEKNYFGIGRRTPYTARRIELNALTPSQLIDYIERKLAEHGANSKVIPPFETISRTMRWLYDTGLQKTIENLLAEAMDIPSTARKIIDNLDRLPLDPATIIKALEPCPPQSWQDLAKQSVEQAISLVVDGLTREEVLSWCR